MLIVAAVYERRLTWPSWPFPQPGGMPVPRCAALAERCHRKLTLYRLGGVAPHNTSRRIASQPFPSVLKIPTPSHRSKTLADLAAGGFPAQESTSLFGKITVTFNMEKLDASFQKSAGINPAYNPSIEWGEVVTHEGAHMLDRFAFGKPVNRSGALRTETNAFDAQSFVPKCNWNQ